MSYNLFSFLCLYRKEETMEEYKKKYEEWLNNPCFDEETKKELESIKDNEKEIEDRFYKELEFGTAGLRGVIGAGSNRMNKYTVGRATQGLANFILKEGTQEKGVAISYDSRHMSKEFSEEAALCLNANGIKTYIFDELRPVPELSFTVRQLKCTAGIMITASHNPPEYNGYKVYWDDGAQIIPPKDKQIIDEVNKTEFSQIKKMNKEDVKTLAQKVATINNISCEIITESSEENVSKTISDYKLNNNKMISNVDNFKVYDNKDEKTLIQIDDNEKQVYVYGEYNSAIDDFESMLCSAEKLLESDEYEYNFKDYETVNGIKCVAFSLSNANTVFNIWLDKSNGMIVKMECNYSSEGGQSISTTLYYRYQLNNVTDEDVQKPNLDGYNVNQL